MPPFRRPPDDDEYVSPNDNEYVSPWAPPKPLRQEMSAAAPARPRERQWGEPERVWLEDQPTMPLPLQRPARQEAPPRPLPPPDGEGGEGRDERTQQLDDGSPFWVWPEQAHVFIEQGCAPQQQSPALVRRKLQFRAFLRRAARGEVPVVPAVAAEGLEPAADAEPASADEAPAPHALAPAQQARRPIIRGSKPYPTEVSFTPVLSRICTNIWNRNAKSIEPKPEDAWVELAKLAKANGVKAIGQRALEDRVHEFYGSWTKWLVKWRALNGL